MAQSDTGAPRVTMPAGSHYTTGMNVLSSTQNQTCPRQLGQTISAEGRVSRSKAIKNSHALHAVLGSFFSYLNFHFCGPIKSTQSIMHTVLSVPKAPLSTVHMWVTPPSYNYSFLSLERSQCPRQGLAMIRCSVLHVCFSKESMNKHLNEGR